MDAVHHYCRLPPFSFDMLALAFARSTRTVTRSVLARAAGFHSSIAVNMPIKVTNVDSSCFLFNCIVQSSMRLVLNFRPVFGLYGGIYYDHQVWWTVDRWTDGFVKNNSFQFQADSVYNCCKRKVWGSLFRSNCTNYFLEALSITCPSWRHLYV